MFPGLCGREVVADMALIEFTLPYAEGMYWLQQVRHLDWPMLLESGRVEAAAGQADVNAETGLGARFDIVVAAPIYKFIQRETHTEIQSARGCEQSAEDPFTLIKRYLLPHQVPRQADTPFAGGAMGYFAYDLGRCIETLPTLAQADSALPAMMVGLYDWAIIVDHHLEQCRLVSHGRYHSQETLAALHAQLMLPGTSSLTTFSVDSEIQPNMTASSYAQAFRRVQDYIRAGDCYQINLAQRFSVQVTGDPMAAYDRFRKLSRAPFMAYLALDDGTGTPITILSMSPERFLQVIDGQVETRPIKGTRPRYQDPEQDAQAAAALATSLKDRAENLMIVDLLRNDIGKVCEVGSVKVDALFKLQRFTNVHHLVSIVRGQLAGAFHALDLLRGCFPGGSITGAPKLRAMEIIEELEPHRRGIYCGSIGYIGFDGAMDTNIAIRTSVIYQGQMTFYAGGGVVADSDCDREYQETLDKASQFFKLVAGFTRTQ